MNNFNYGRTLTKLFNFKSSSEIPPATPNGGVTVGESCVGEHCSIPIKPTTLDYYKYLKQNGVNNLGNIKPKNIDHSNKYRQYN